MNGEQLFDALVRLCKEYGYPSDTTYELLHGVVSSLETDPGD